MTVPRFPVASVPSEVPEVEGVKRTLRGPEETWTRSLIENLVEAGGVDGASTIKLKVVVFGRSPPVAVTVMIEVPIGVEAKVEIVITVEQVGLQLGGEKEEVAPKGRPDTEKVTGPVTPESKEVVMFVAPELPWPTVIFPELERATLKAAEAEKAGTKKATNNNALNNFRCIDFHCNNVCYIIIDMEEWIILHSNGAIKNEREARVLMLLISIVSITVSIYILAETFKSAPLPPKDEILRDIQRDIRE